MFKCHFWKVLNLSGLSIIICKLGIRRGQVYGLCDITRGVHLPQCLTQICFCEIFSLIIFHDTSLRWLQVLVFLRTQTMCASPVQLTIVTPLTLKIFPVWTQILYAPHCPFLAFCTLASTPKTLLKSITYFLSSFSLLL